MAEETAVYNTGEPGTTEPVPDVPFLVLIDDATVKPGTMLYVPVFNWNDGSQLLVSPFPKDLRDQKEDADYLLDTADAYADAEITAFIVQVDGKTTILSADYAVGVKTPPLPDGGGTHYIVSAAFITPLAPGDHTGGDRRHHRRRARRVCFLYRNRGCRRGKVLPPDATPKGYSLSDMAEETTVYNTGERAGLTEPAPEVPFHVLVDDATVRAGTTLYLPVFFADDSGPPTTPPFPKDLDNQEEGCRLSARHGRRGCRRRRYHGFHSASRRHNHGPVR